MNGRFNIQSVAPRVLGGDEHVLPRKPALPHSSSGLLLVAVHLRSVCRYNVCPRSADVAVMRGLLRRARQHKGREVDVPMWPKPTDMACSTWSTGFCPLPSVHVPKAMLGMALPGGRNVQCAR